MIKVVADTNVYISALHFGGVADAVLALGRAREVLLYVSPSILEEIEGVLVHKFAWSMQRVRDAITAIRAFTTVVHPHETITRITEDDPDNRILECAVAANAQVIITGDRHLLRVKTF